MQLFDKPMQNTYRDTTGTPMLQLLSKGRGMMAQMPCPQSGIVCPLHRQEDFLRLRNTNWMAYTCTRCYIIQSSAKAQKSIMTSRPELKPTVQLRLDGQSANGSGVQGGLQIIVPNT